jgi:hypothetical protein
VRITSLHKNESFILELEVPPGVASGPYHMGTQQVQLEKVCSLNSMATYVHYLTEVGGFIVGY